MTRCTIFRRDSAPGIHFLVDSAIDLDRGSIVGRAIPRLKIFSDRSGFGDFFPRHRWKVACLVSAVFYFLTVQRSR